MRSPNLIFFLSMLAVATTACGARTDLASGSAAGGNGAGAGGVGSGAGGVGAGGSSSSTGGGAAPPGCTWSFASTTPTIIAQHPVIDAFALDDVAVSDDEVWIAARSDEAHTWELHLAKDDLSAVRPGARIASGGQKSAPMYLAFSGDARGSIAWDDADGCQFRLLTEAGAVATTNRIGSSGCFRLLARPNGENEFYAFRDKQKANVHLLFIEESGDVFEKDRNAITGDDVRTTAPLSALVLDGSELAFAWADGTGATVARTFSPERDQGGQSVQLGAPTQAVFFAMTKAGDRIVYAFSDVVKTTFVEFFTWKPGTASPEVGLKLNGLSGVDVAAAGSGVLAAVATDNGVVQVQPLTTSAARDGALLETPSSGASGPIRIVATARGAMVVFKADNGESIKALNLVCTN